MDHPGDSPDVAPPHSPHLVSIALTTPTGHIGSAIVRHLLDAGRDDLILLVRDATKLPADVRGRVETREGVLQDAGFVREATAGADALFWLSPNDWTAPVLTDWYDALAASASGAVEANRIGRVVHLSSEGAQDRVGLGPVSGLGRIEEALDATGAAVRHLRPTFFMENFAEQLGAIAHTGAVYFPAPPETTTGMIATRDIAERAAGLLADPSWSGRVVVALHGPADRSYADAAAVIGQALGRDVAAVEVPADALVAQFVGMGASPDYAAGLVRLYQRIGSEGYALEPRTGETTTPTTLEAYVADTLRPAFAAMPAPDASPVSA